MRRRQLTEWGLAACLACGCASVPTRPLGPRIDDFRIEGASQVPEAEIKSKVLTTEAGFFPDWFPFLGDPQHFDANAWAADLRRVVRYYQARGYYQARVLEEEKQEVPGHIRLLLKVFEGVPATLFSLDVQGLDALSEEHRTAALAALQVKVGAVFLEDEWEGSKEALVAALKEAGYPEAALEAEAVVDPEEARVTASLKVTSGPRYRFGNTFVASDANAQVPVKRIVDEIEDVVPAGDWYSESALAKAQARIYALNVFAAVKVTRGAPDREAFTVPVVVDVREAPFRTLRAGGGIGIDTLRQEARLVGEFTHRNFFGGLRRASVRARIGYALLPNIVAVAQAAPGAEHGVIFNLVNEFEQPWVFFRTLSFKASLDISRTLEPAYNSIGGSLKAGLSWRPRPDFSFTPGYGLDVYFLSTEVSLGGTAPEKLFDCPKTCVISYLEQTFEFDRRDSRTEPTEGFLLGLGFQEGGGPLGGSFTFLRILPEVRGYVSFGPAKRFTLAGKVKLGTLITAQGDGPIVSRFFSGGSNMRGFSSRRLSPQLVVPSQGGTLQCGDSPPPMPPGTCSAPYLLGETIPVGGKGLFEASFEARWKVNPDWVLAAFYDVGSVTRDSFDFGAPGYFLANLNHAVGLGVRYLTALGPIRIDVAGRLPIGNPPAMYPPKTDVPVTYPAGGFFAIGTRPARHPTLPDAVVALHFSVGEAY